MVHEIWRVVSEDAIQIICTVRGPCLTVDYRQRCGLGIAFWQAIRLDREAVYNARRAWPSPFSHKPAGGGRAGAAGFQWAARREFTCCVARRLPLSRHIHW